MLKQNSNSCTNRNHGLTFSIEGAVITVDEMGHWIADLIENFESEAMQEAFARDAAHQIFIGVGEKVEMAKAAAEKARVRRLWIGLHPPNHAGYYYCHIGGEWVHIDVAELEHIIPSSVEKINTDEPGWDDKLRMSCHVHNFLKGSKRMASATMEIAPPDGDC